jgi:hypothetical protein
MVMIIINHLKSISSEHGRKTKMYFVKLTGLVILLFFTLSSFLSCKQACTSFLPLESQQTGDAQQPVI